MVRIHVGVTRGPVPEHLDQQVHVGVVDAAKPIEAELPGSARVAAVNSAAMAGHSSAYFARKGCRTMLRIMRSGVLP